MLNNGGKFGRKPIFLWLTDNKVSLFYPLKKNSSIVNMNSILYIIKYNKNIGEFMHKIQLLEDIQPLSKFRSKVAYYFDQVRKTKRPLVITQNGKSSAILLDVSEYQQMIDKIEVLEDIRLSESQINKGLAVTHKDVRKKFAKRV
jgi:prevent-host-death family protein